MRKAVRHPAGKRPRLAVVVPVYGNEGSLPELYRRITAAVVGCGVELVLQFVNDRSPDGSQAVLERLAASDARVRVLLLSRNHGSFTAIAAGLAQVADCDAAVILSADLQDPPEMLPEMLASWRSGKKVVLCARRRREDPGVSKFLAQAFHTLYRKLVMPEMPPGGFDFCLIDRCVVRVILQSSEKKTSLIGLIVWAGFDRAILEYDRAERVHGHSMWTFGKKLSYAFHSVVAFSSFPLRIFVLLGLLMSILSAIGIAYVVVASLLGFISTPGWPSVIVLELVIVSVLFLGFGIVGGYLWNNLEQTRKRPLFIVDKSIGRKPSSSSHSCTRRRRPGCS
ncbi:glycosyl transferase family 2 [Solidesulfovibrio fructosivorans JJ]]|uniref:Glycosyl transferase family 2 n=1 Tax=Solidesulfovibrio fructosivorans JJ] TaxID=596151 RepID=E1JXR9_SOLFR|nr:glycosyltransferase family 2 protein [Solidesulfovibrio fructosivorans]EFL50842.1 glycosyl transferase family 2 [Solidesulfovibrio fructosivorans JJ]]